MFKKHRFLASNIILFSIYIFLINSSYAYVAQDYKWIPPFLTKEEKPTVHLIFDSSGSMEFRAYGNSTEDAVHQNFNSKRRYYGYFNPEKYYTYVENSTDQLNSYFTEATSGDLWNGNFLNWLTMHRDDIAKKVMIGGDFNATSGIYTLTPVNTWREYTWARHDDTIAVEDLNGDDKFMTPLIAHNTTSRSKAISNYYHQAANSNSPSILYVTSRLPTQSNAYSTSYHKKKFTLRLKAPQTTGVLDKFVNKARISLFQYHPVSSSNDGANILSYVAETANELSTLKSKLSNIDPNGGTPLAESLWTVCGYIRQDNTAGSNGPRYPRGNTELQKQSYNATLGLKGDPFYFSEYGKLVPCTQQTVIMITDGEPSVADASTNPAPTSAPSSFREDREDNKDKLQDVAWWARTTDLRTDTTLPGVQRINFFTIFASFGETAGSSLLRKATQFGSFTDKNKDGLYNAADLESSDFVSPENFFEASSGEELEAAVTQALAIATAGVASGTSASLPPTTGGGEGAVYQAIFFQPAANTVLGPGWGGQLHGLLVDANGNMREDTSKNKFLNTDPNDADYDKIIRFIKADATEYITRYDSNGTAETKGLNINEINLLWSSTDWLNSLSDMNITTNRSYESSDSRYIFTFVDKNGDMVFNSFDETPAFTHNAMANCADGDYFCSYLTLYGNNSGTLSPSTSLSTSQLRDLAEEQINFIRGKDVGNSTIARSRTFGGKTWRLGDIIYSSPTVVAKPAENYHLIYKDKTYQEFVKRYLGRRQMVYVGANDGMLHAFNAGFYVENSTHNGFLTSPAGEHNWPLGMEVWAYAPFNLLPHLKWLMHPAYGSDLHVAYMDLKPRVFDARVFFTDSTNQISQDNSTYPNGWGTILVAGMRLGGAKIDVDINKDGSSDRSMSSAYVIMDITNPESPPKLIAEIALPKQGFTTCYPTVMPMTQRNTSNSSENQWYLVFGSGPADASGQASRFIFGSETSGQPGHLYVVDLKSLVADRTLNTVNGTGSISSSYQPYGLTEPNSTIFDPVAVDLDIGPVPSAKEFRTDLIYFGSAAGTLSNPTGKMYRLNTNNNSTAYWDSISTLINVGKPITSAPSVAKDEAGRIWVYFGTGRLFNKSDIPQSSKMAFFGVKEPIESVSKEMTWGTVSTSALFNSTNITLSNGTCAEINDINCVKVSEGGVAMNGTWPNGHWNNLLDAVKLKDGWRIDFGADRERVIGQPATLGGLVIFTSNTPKSDVCEAFDAESSLWAVYYETGTAFFRPILGASGDIFKTSESLGRGLSFTPTLHVGENGASAFIQTSTGAILTLELETPFNVRSGPLYWRNLTSP